MNQAGGPNPTEYMCALTDDCDEDAWDAQVAGDVGCRTCQVEGLQGVFVLLVEKRGAGAYRQGGGQHRSLLTREDARRAVTVADRHTAVAATQGRDHTSTALTERRNMPEARSLSIIFCSATRGTMGGKPNGGGTLQGLSPARIG